MKHTIIQSKKMPPKKVAKNSYCQIGKVVAKNKEELGKKSIQHIGLGLDNTENIGKWVVKKTIDSVSNIKCCRVEHWQKAWGYDEKNNYTMLPAMRTYKDSNDFGMIVHSKEAIFVPEDKLEIVREYLAIKYAEGSRIIMETEEAPTSFWFEDINKHIRKLISQHNIFNS